VKIEKTFDEVASLAQQGDAKYQYEYALMFELGLSIEKDLDQAFAWYKKSANQEHPKAQYNLGIFYALGKTGEKDIAKSKYWIKKAHDNGYSGASIF